MEINWYLMLVGCWEEPMWTGRIWWGRSQTMTPVFPLPSASSQWDASLGRDLSSYTWGAPSTPAFIFSLFGDKRQTGSLSTFNGQFLSSIKSNPVLALIWTSTTQSQFFTSCLERVWTRCTPTLAWMGRNGSTLFQDNACICFIKMQLNCQKEQPSINYAEIKIIIFHGHCLAFKWTLLNNSR